MSFLQKNWRLAASGLLALIVVPAGIAKLMGVPAVHASFGILGLPVWFGYFIGAAEVAGGVALFVPKLARLAALGLAVIGLGAVYFHAMHTPLAQGIPAMVVLVLSGLLALNGRKAAVAAA
jgi:putative oxidoreductase